MKPRCVFQTKKDMVFHILLGFKNTPWFQKTPNKTNVSIIYHQHHTQLWTLSNVTVEVKSWNREMYLPKKTSCTVQLYLFVRWIMMLLMKIRKLVTSALWLQAMSKTRLILQPSFASFLIFSANRRGGWFLCSGNFWLKWVFWNFWNDWDFYEIFYFYSYTT